MSLSDLLDLTKALAYFWARLATLILAVIVTVTLNRRQGISARTTLLVAALSIPVAIQAAQLLDILEYWDSTAPVGALLSRGGSSIYGALFACFVVTWAVSAWQGLSARKFLDAGAPAMALGEAVSRIGCFFAGCCYGTPWQGPFAVTYPKDSFAYTDQIARGLLDSSAPHSLSVHPVQLYSTALMSIAFVYLLRLFKHRRFDGEVFSAFLVSYGALRLLMMPFRMEALASMKLFSIGFIVVGTLGLVIGLRQSPLARPARGTPAVQG